MKTSQEGIDLIVKFEGLRLNTYRCPAGVLTIGVGHTGQDVYEGQTITREKAYELLKADLRRFEVSVNKLVRRELRQCEFDALVSLIFNIGTGNFAKSTLLKKINSNVKDEEIFNEWRKWKLAGGRILAGLVKRREAEIQMYKGEV